MDHRRPEGQGSDRIEVPFALSLTLIAPHWAVLGFSSMASPFQQLRAKLSELFQLEAPPSWTLASTAS
ncbi:MAG TPA: hypothetical protein PLB55_10045, partial [Prosthecobacter sp.]|nr:hypothetical protein [Prosthecobacter sp.]